MNIVILDALTFGNAPTLHQFKKFGELTTYTTTSSEERKARLKHADIAITNKVIIDRPIIDACPNLKLVCIAATGTNNVDIAYAEEKGIIVKNAQNYSTASVAQFTFANILSLLCKCHYYDSYVKSGKYSKSPIFTHIHHDFFQLEDKKFGIIGLGNIGHKMAKIAEGFGMEVMYFSTSGQNNDQPYRNVTLQDLLTQCDIISIHAPLNEQTQSLINYEALQLMKPTSIIANSGRGGIIVEIDLARALDEKKIAGAAIDVFEKEPLSVDHPFLHLKNPETILLTPHITWASIESRTKLLDIVAEHIRKFLNKH